MRREFQAAMGFAQFRRFQARAPDSDGRGVHSDSTTNADLYGRRMDEGHISSGCLKKRMAEIDAGPDQSNTKKCRWVFLEQLRAYCPVLCRLEREGLPVGERQLVQPNRIGLLLVVAILLIVERDAIPRGRGWGLVVVQGRSLTVQRDRLE